MDVLRSRNPPLQKALSGLDFGALGARDDTNILFVAEHARPCEGSLFSREVAAVCVLG